jgi:hypothetical protein
MVVLVVAAPVVVPQLQQALAHQGKETQVALVEARQEHLMLMVEVAVVELVQ